jgi:hypothetical protein
MRALHQFYRPERVSGRSAHDAKCTRLHDVGVDDGLRAIHEDRAAPHIVDFTSSRNADQSPDSTAAATDCGNTEHDLSGAVLPRRG